MLGILNNEYLIEVLKAQAIVLLKFYFIPLISNINKFEYFEIGALDQLLHNARWLRSNDKADLELHNI